MTTATRTTCPYCGVGCGVVVRQAGDGVVTVEGDKLHPANFGKLCTKGAALPETIGLEGRQLHPTVDGVAVSWDRALDTVAARFARIVREHGPDAVAAGFSRQVQHLMFSRNASAGVLYPRHFLGVELTAHVISSISRAV